MNVYPRSMVGSYNGWLCTSSSSSTSLCVVIQNPTDVLSPTRPHSPSDLLMVHTVCGSHTVSVTDRQPSCWLLSLAVWHDPCISRPPQLECQNWAKNCQLVHECISGNSAVWEIRQLHQALSHSTTHHHLNQWYCLAVHAAVIASLLKCNQNSL